MSKIILNQKILSNTKNFVNNSLINKNKNKTIREYEMINKKSTPAPEMPSPDLNKILRTYDFTKLKNWSKESGKKIKICFWSHCMTDKKTWMNWGDFWVKKQLEYSLIKLFGSEVTTVENKADAEIVIYLFGSPYKVNKNQINIVWFYSHPEKMTVEEADKYDYMFCASDKYLTKMERWNFKNCKLSTKPLYACTNFKFKNTTKMNTDILFIGNARSNKIYGRKAVKVLNSIFNSNWVITLIGAKWELPRFAYAHKWYKGKYLPYSELPEAYTSTKINLIDGHEEMQNESFVSAKVFDTIAAGGNIIMEYNSGVKELFGDSIKMYKNPKELWDLIKKELEKDVDIKELKKLSEIAIKYSYDYTLKRMYTEFMKKLKVKSTIKRNRKNEKEI